MDDEADIVSADEFLDDGGVDDADVVAEGRACGFGADGVELEWSRMVAAFTQRVDQGSEVGEGVPMARDDYEGACGAGCGGHRCSTWGGGKEMRVRENGLELFCLACHLTDTHSFLTFTPASDPAAADARVRSSLADGVWWGGIAGPRKAIPFLPRLALVVTSRIRSHNSGVCTERESCAV